MKKSKSKKPPSKKSAAPKKAPAAKPKRAGKSPTPVAKKSPPKPVGKKSSKRGDRAPEKPAPKDARKARKSPEEAPVGAATASSAPAAPPQAPAPAPAPAPRRAPAAEPAIDAYDDEHDGAVIKGEAVDGRRFSRAIQYAAKVTPKENDVVFTLDPKGIPLISGHDQHRCHTAYLPLGAAFHLRASVPRADAMKLAKCLDGLAGPMVRVGADGEVLIRHGVGQPAMRFRLGTRSITQSWEPPSRADRKQAEGSLKVNAAWQGAACRWGCATVDTWQSSDGIEWCTIKDEDTGEHLATAVIAGFGRDLYAEDDRQTEIAGSRTAGSAFDRAVTGMNGGGVAGAVGDLNRTLREHGATLRLTTGDGRSATLDGAAAPVLSVDGQPVGADESGDARAWIRAAAFRGLSLKASGALMELVDRETVDVDAAEGWVRVEVPGVARRALSKVAETHGFAVHFGDEPPADAPPAATAAPEEGARLWIEAAAWEGLDADGRESLSSVEGEDGAGVEGTAAIVWERRGDFVTTLVSEGVATVLWNVAADADVDLHEAPVPPVRVWITEAEWDDLDPEARDAFSDPVDGATVTMEGRAGWVTALVPAAVLPHLEKLADAHEVTLHLGAAPPATIAAAGADG